jgi:hypothetical protein
MKARNFNFQTLLGNGLALAAGLLAASLHAQTSNITYSNHPAPPPLGRTAGEPSIGTNWKTGKVFIESNLQTLRVTFDDCSSPAKTTWEDKSAPTSITSLDPILFTDSRTSRTVPHPCCRFHR